MRNYLLLLTKLIIAGTALAVVFYQVEIDKMWKVIQDMHPLYGIAAFIIMVIAQIISGLRMHYYCHAVECMLTRMRAVSLYFIGLFFNMLLPGGIGGDGYKAVIFSKYYGLSTLAGIRVVLSERASGLLLLIIFSIGFILASKAIYAVPYIPVLLAILGVCVIPVYSVGVWVLLKESPKTSLGAVPYSFMVQLLNVVVAILLLQALGLVDVHLMDYLVLFMISAIVAILPISIGGVGLRELTFYYGASWLMLDVEASIAFSLLFFAITFLVSLLGVVFFIRVKHTT